jgi:integrase
MCPPSSAFARSIEGPYTAAMEYNRISGLDAQRSQGSDSTKQTLPGKRDLPCGSGSTSVRYGSIESPGSPTDSCILGLGRRLPRKEAPEGWVKRIERSRQGKVWVGFFHLWTTDASGRCTRTKKEKTLGPGSMPKHEAQEKLAQYIEEYTGRLTKEGSSIITFQDLWRAYSSVKAGEWSTKTKKEMRYLFGKHVLPIVGLYALREVTLTSLQLLLNKLAEDGHCQSTVYRIRTYLKACFEYAADEDLIAKNPARKLATPKIRKKVCERFLSLKEIGALLSEAAPREHLVLRILAACGLRPAEVLALRMEDFQGNQLRIDEALKDGEKGSARIGRTKTEESDSSVPLPTDLGREVAAWIAEHPDRMNPRAFIFPNRIKTPYTVRNYLKRYLQPLARKVGIEDLTHQALRRTSSTHIQEYASVKELQAHLRHTNPQTALKHYTKVIPESLHAAVAALDDDIATAANESKQRSGRKATSDEPSPLTKGKTVAASKRVVSIDAWRKRT